MRVICPHCQTIYQLQGLEPDTVLVCHRCGTEFGLGEKPEGAQDVATSVVPDRQTPDMFASLPGETDDEPQAETGSEQDLFPDEPLPEEGVSPPADEPAAESIGTFSFPAPDDVSETEHADESDAAAETDHDSETEQAPAPEDVAEAESGHAIEPVIPHEQRNVDADEQTGDDAGEAGDELPGPVIIPAREAWPEDPATPVAAAPQSGPADEADALDVEQDDFAAGPPPRAKARIMPWLITVVLLIGGTGFWVNHETWLDDPWLRSVLINTGVKMQIRDKDWRVQPDSVSAVWIERKNAGTALVITGEAHNLLQTELRPPLIHVTLYAQDNPDEIIAERDEIITRPPLMQTIRSAPYSPPPRDDTPIIALGKRGFILVLEDLPQNAGNFTLQAKAR